MVALVDTCIWSLSLRRKSKQPSAVEGSLRKELHELVDEGRTRLVGPIRQEILSGIREASQYERLRENLRAFPDEPLTVDDYELAAEFSNRCQTAGIANSSVDLLICAIAAGRKWSVFTCDGDFDAYRRVLGISLHQLRK